MKYLPPFNIERAPASIFHMRGWVVWDAANNRCQDADGTWLWARKVDAQEFVRELLESVNSPPRNGGRKGRNR